MLSLKLKKIISRFLLKTNLDNNRSIINNISVYKGDKKTYAYYVEFLSFIGGTETRLSLFFEKLIENGNRVVVLTSDQTVNKFIVRNCRVYFINIKSNTLVKDIVNILLSENASIFEINHTPSFIRDVKNVEFFQNFFKVGIHLHHKASDHFIDSIRKDAYDYKIINSEKHIKNYGDSSIVIRNSIESFKIKDIYHNGRSKKRKAILISRLDGDKLISVESAIKYFIKNDLDFEIAGGNVFSKSIKGHLISKYKIKPSQFIGAVSTYVFLESHIDDYLFVAGVGQVVLEAGALGFPVLCADVKNESSFFTKSNYLESLETNLTTINNDLCHIPALKNISGNQNLNICCLIRDENDLDKNCKKYMRILENN